MSGNEKLGRFLKEASNWEWDEFARAELNKKYTTNEAIIFALIRACTLEKIEAIRIALNRLDGKLKTPIKIELPKVFYIFPNATLDPGDMKKEIVKHNAREKNLKHLPGGVEILEGEVIPPKEEEKKPEVDLPSLNLRETLAEMANYPRELPEGIVKLALETEQWLKKNGPKPFEIPKVKSVVAAHLLIMAQNRNIDALTEVFDQIDGKLVETIQLIGDDIYITSYIETAPPGAKLNADGVPQIEAETAQRLWAQKLENRK